MQYPSNLDNIHHSNRNPEICMEAQTNRPPAIAKEILSKKKKKRNALYITIHDFRSYYGAIVTETAWYWYKNRHIDQWNRLKDPEISPHGYSYLILDKDAKNKLRKDSLFKWCWKNWISTCTSLKMDPCLLLCIKINSKYIKSHNIRPENL
jgi:hypothetical protein